MKQIFGRSTQVQCDMRVNGTLGSGLPAHFNKKVEETSEEKFVGSDLNQGWCCAFPTYPLTKTKL